MDPVPRPRRNPLQDDMATGLKWSMCFMRSLEAAVCMTAEAPLNRVKLLLQNQGELIRTGRLSTPYLGIKDCFSKTIKNEGVISLWRGNSVNLVGLLSRKVLLLSFHSQISEIAFRSTNDKHQRMHWQKELVDAASLGLYMCLYPLDYAHTRLANNIKCHKGNGERKFNSLLDLYRKTFKSDGIVGSFRGLNVGLSGLLVERCFGLLYEGQVHSKPSKEKPSTFLAEVLLATGLLTTYPIETVQRRVMMTSGEVTKYKSSSDAFMQIIKNEGMQSLYKGFGAYLLGVIPMFLCTHWFRKLQKDPSGSISVVIHTD